ncbi:MAG: tRNA 4-thiouridine(8) synthase ThiI, partial [Spirochaetales bacterium]|nr:tRNA 4-thiouridine(8) synthase ThiI [Spirochaetales bacterium]
LKIGDDCPREVVDTALSTTFGIVGYSRSFSAPKELEAIHEAAREAIGEGPFAEGKGSFKVISRRADKSFPLTSYQLDVELAKTVHEVHPDLTVDVKNPDLVLYCEIRDKAYLYTTQKKGLGGLPVGSAGKGLLLLSGGLDSPVAGFLAAKRGVKMDCLYFHAYPYTSDEALEKVKTLASLIAPYLQGTRLWVAHFTEAQLQIKRTALENETTLMFRAAMMTLANRHSEWTGSQCIITGEALSQVASQTLEGLSFSDSFSEQLVLRPLIGMDKQEIMDLARKIGTYETSILPYEDCCVLFSPKHPLTRPDKAVATEHYNTMGIEPFIEEALSNLEVFHFNELGEIIEENRPTPNRLF